jgi:hypothetical protein
MPLISVFFKRQTVRTFIVNSPILSPEDGNRLIFRNVVFFITLDDEQSPETQ